MPPYFAPVRVLRVIVLASLMLAAFASIAGAQSTPATQSSQPAGAPVVRVDNPVDASTLAGQTTFEGVAVNCATRQPATGVSVYLDRIAPDAYLADVSMQTTRPLSVACPGATGTAQIGFMLIHDLKPIQDGPHTLYWVARFPDGSTATMQMDTKIQNLEIWEPSEIPIRELRF